MSHINENVFCKVGFIGAGNMAKQHLRSFADISNVKLSGIISRTRSKAELLASEFKMEGAYDSIGELFHNTKADLVVISVPELNVREVCLEAFKYPWTCLIEKPAGYNFEDAEIIYTAALTSNTKAFVALNRRLYSSTLSVLKELSTSNQTRLIHIFDQEDTKAALSGGQPPLVVENWMYANAIHLIDYFSILGRGKVTSVEPIIKWNPLDPEFVMAKIMYDSGDIGIYEAVWNAPGPWSVTVTTQEKRWELRPMEQAFFQIHGSRTLQPFEIHPWDKQFKPGLRLQAQEAIKAALNQQHQLPSLFDALHSMKLVKQIYF